MFSSLPSSSHPQTMSMAAPSGACYGAPRYGEGNSQQDPSSSSPHALTAADEKRAQQQQQDDISSISNNNNNNEKMMNAEEDGGASAVEKITSDPSSSLSSQEKQHRASMATHSSANSYVKDTYPQLHAHRQRQQRLASAQKDEETGRRMTPAIVVTTPPLWRRVLSHLRRWWFVYVPSFLLVILIILLVIFLAVIPSLIRGHVDRNTFPLVNGSIEAISPNQIRVAMTSQVSGPSAYTVRLDAFDLHLSNDKRDNEEEEGEQQQQQQVHEAPGRGPFGKRHDQTNTKNKNKGTHELGHDTFLTLKVPKQTISGTSDMVIAPQIVPVENASELSTFLTRAFTGVPTEGGGSLRVRGSTTARLAALSTVVQIDKVVRFGGMNQLDGTHVTNTEAVIPFAEDGTNMQGSLMVVNTSPFTMSLGNVTCTVVGMMPGLLEGYMGDTTVSDLVIQPGNQTLDFRGQLDVTAMSTKMMNVPMDKGVQETGLVQVAFQGNQSVVNGEQIHYLDDVLTKMYAQADVPVEVGAKVLMEKLSSSAGK